MDDAEVSLRPQQFEHNSVFSLGHWHKTCLYLKKNNDEIQFLYCVKLGISNVDYFLMS